MIVRSTPWNKALLPESIFPLAIEDRYIVTAQGTPFLLHGDAAWSIVGQLTDAQCDQYLDNRAAKGFNCILFNAPEYYYTNQTPAYNNVDGVAPFSSMTDYASALTSYWNRVDRVVTRAKALGMVCIINPAYLGYPGGPDGWHAEVAAETDADLQTYGAALANRFTQGNVIWSMGGDSDSVATGSSTLSDKQWNIVTGIRSVRTTDVITAHPLSDVSNSDDAYTYWAGYTGFNLNMIYGSETGGAYVYAMASQAYARAMPFLGFEFRYEQEADWTAAMLRRQSYGALLSGACGQIFGNSPIWHFESAHAPYSYTGTWQSNMDSTGSVEQTYVRALMLAYAWWKLVPTTDASLVSSSLSTNATRIYPALASDGTFAMIYVPSSQTVTVVTNALTGISGNVRIRLYDPTTGSYSVNQASVAKSAGQSVATGGECVIVVDAP